MTVARRTTAKAFAENVFISQERKLEVRRRSDTALVLTVNDVDQQSATVTTRTVRAASPGKPEFLDSGGSMVAKLKPSFTEAESGERDDTGHPCFSFPIVALATTSGTC